MEGWRMHALVHPQQKWCFENEWVDFRGFASMTNDFLNEEGFWICACIRIRRKSRSAMHAYICSAQGWWKWVLDFWMHSHRRQKLVVAQLKNVWKLNVATFQQPSPSIVCSRLLGSGRFRAKRRARGRILFIRFSRYGAWTWLCWGVPSRNEHVS